MGVFRNRRFHEVVADVATIGVALAALAVSGSVAWERLGGKPKALTDQPVDAWDELVSTGRRIGPESAPVVVVEFGDYECPFCRRAERDLRALLAAYPEDVALVYHHFPIPYHQHAYRAARYAECAWEQGAFNRVHNLLYDAIELEGLDAGSVADAARIADMDRYSACVGRTSEVPAIERDMDLARRVGITGVPSIIVQGILLAVPDSATLFKRVRDRLPSAGRGHRG